MPKSEAVVHTVTKSKLYTVNVVLPLRQPDVGADTIILRIDGKRWDLQPNDFQQLVACLYTAHQTIFGPPTPDAAVRPSPDPLDP